MIFETSSQFCTNFSPFCHNLYKLEHKCQAKLKEAHLRESKRISKGQGDFTPIIGRKVLLTRHFDNSLSVYLSLEFQPQLGKSETFNNQGMKENKTFRIPFITKKELKSRQTLHRVFFKPQYKVYRGASILYCDASFSDVPPFSKMSKPPRQKQQFHIFNAYSKFQCIITLYVHF